MNYPVELKKIASILTGKKLNLVDIDFLRRSLPSDICPDWVLSLMENYNLAGSNFSLDESHDESGLGVELSWSNAQQIIEESSLFYPGRLFVNQGYLPIGSCLTGSGDSYFLKIKNSKRIDEAVLVRIPHDLSFENDLCGEKNIEIVCFSIVDFFKFSKVY